MIIIGVLLVAAAVVFGVDLIVKNHHAHMISPVVFGHSLGLTSEAALFILGAITGAAILLGLALIVAGMRYRRNRNRPAFAAKLGLSMAPGVSARI